MGGTLGTRLAGVFATAAVNRNLADPRIAAYGGHGLWFEQLKAGAIVLVWSVVGTVVAAKIVGLTLGTLRVSEENETVGLDVAEHGEEGYISE